MALQINENKCCGCFACLNICPVNAIYKKMEEGFEFPIIDLEKCINCKRCEQVCPIESDMHNISNARAYICKSLDEEIRKNSSSGGVFSEIAKEIISENGVVYGAAYDKDFHIEHNRVDNIDDLEMLRNSKYVQSRIDQIYEKVIDDLREGKKVLFSGTPCQIKAVNNLCNANKIGHDKLFTVSVICHGILSPNLFELYKIYLEQKYESKIVSINMREKSISWHRFCFSVQFQNGKQYKRMHELDPFFHLFLSNKYLRKSCYACSWKGINEDSDIILGDAWGYSGGYERNDNTGYSLVITTNDKGEKLINQISLFKENWDEKHTKSTHESLYTSASLPKNSPDIFPEIIDKDHSVIFFKQIKVGNITKLITYAKLIAEKINLMNIIRNKPLIRE